MKNQSNVVYAFFFALSLLLFACSGTKNAGMTSSKVQGKDYSNLTSLVDILRKQGGLQISETGTNVRVLIRGINTIQLDPQPLYVINGTPVGHNYNRANNALNVNDITSVRVLKSMADTNRYGEEGRNGVILIKTRVANN